MIQLYTVDILENKVTFRILLLVLFIALSGCLKDSDVVYILLSKNQNIVSIRVNGNAVKDFDSLGDKLRYLFKDKKHASLSILFANGVALSDAVDVIGLAQAIGYSNIKLYSINLTTEKMQEINRSKPEPVSDDTLKIIGAK